MPSDQPILGQEAICPKGLGRVAWFDKDQITVRTYINDQSCTYSRHNVELIDPRNP